VAPASDSTLGDFIFPFENCAFLCSTLQVSSYKSIEIIIGHDLLGDREHGVLWLMMLITYTFFPVRPIA